MIAKLPTSLFGTKTVEIDVTKIETLDYLQHCNMKTLKAIANNAKSLPEVRKAAK